MRASWDEYFLELAAKVATRATCPRKAVGCVLVKNRRIVATGYNGSPSGLAHCDDVGCQLIDKAGRQSCIRTVHAEANALLQAGRESIGSRAYITIPPCIECAKLLIQGGVRSVKWQGQYVGSDGIELLNRAGLVTA